MSVPTVHDKPTEIKRLTVQQLLFEHVRVCQAFHCFKNVGGPAVRRPKAQLHVSLQNLPHRGSVALGKGIVELYKRIAARNQLNCRGSRPHSHTSHHEEVVPLTPRTLFITAKSHFCIGLSISLPCRKMGVAHI